MRALSIVIITFCGFKILHFALLEMRCERVRGPTLASYICPLSVLKFKMAAQFEVLSSVAGWSPRPAPFNVRKCGKRVRFSEDASVAERVEPENYWWDAVVYTAQPLAVGQVWRVTVQNTTRTWSGFEGLVSVWVLYFL